MGASKKSLAANRYILSGSLKKKGISILRFVFNGIEKGTGVERKFFIELVMLNPWLSPSETVLGFKSRVNVSAEDLQNRSGVSSSVITALQEAGALADLPESNQISLF